MFKKTLVASLIGIAAVGAQAADLDGFFVVIQVKKAEGLLYYCNEADLIDLILTWIATIFVSAYGMKQKFRNDGFA